MKIKSNRIYSCFNFQPVNYEEAFAGKIDIPKATPLERIYTKISKQNLNIFAAFSVKVTNKWIKKGQLPDKLKAPDVTPLFKKEKT